MGKTIPDTSGLGKEKDCNTKATEIEGKIPSITDLATTAGLNTVKNKIPNNSDLIEKQIMMQKSFTLRLAVLPHLIIINLQIKDLMII